MNRPIAPRGYLMLEVGVAGAMAAAVIAGLLVQLASAQSETTIHSRDVTAQAVATAVLNEVRTREFADIASRGPAVREVGGARYTVSVTATANTDAFEVPSIDSFPDEDFGDPPARSRLSLDYKDITVDATWSSPRGPRTKSVRSRAYSFRPIR